MAHQQGRRLLRTSRRALSHAGMSMLRVTLLFGSVAVALTLILVPMADRFSRPAGFGAGVDYMTTGSIDRTDRYTIRRSVLQEQGLVCIIRADGSRRGDC